MNGPYTAQFESWLANKNKTKHAVTVHSGTSALEVIAEFFKEEFVITPRVLIPSFTFAATANAFIRAGWDVHFIDVDSYGVIDLDKIPNIEYQAVVLVGLYGASITHILESRMWAQWDIMGLIVIEDAAQHWLADDCERIAVSAISFDPMKNLPCYGNGGAILTNDVELAEYAKKWRQHGNLPNQAVGSNSRMSEMDCSLMMVKSQYIDQWQARRKTIAEYYMSRFQAANIRCLIDDTNREGHSFHKFVIDIDNRNDVQKQLLDCGIETKIHYTHPLHEVGMFSRYTGPDILSCASSLARRVLSLPIYPELEHSEIEYITETLLKVVS
jgi:UDP-2-acetamido-2-deoxy-ribo-hexuluronate aminotransferase